VRETDVRTARIADAAQDIDKALGGHENGRLQVQHRAATPAIWLEDELRKRRRCTRCHKFEEESSQYLRWVAGDEPAFGFDGRGQ